MTSENLRVTDKEDDNGSDVMMPAKANGPALSAGARYEPERTTEAETPLPWGVGPA